MRDFCTFIQNSKQTTSHSIFFLQLSRRCYSGFSFIGLMRDPALLNRVLYLTTANLRLVESFPQSAVSLSFSALFCFRVLKASIYGVYY